MEKEKERLWKGEVLRQNSPRMLEASPFKINTPSPACPHSTPVQLGCLLQSAWSTEKSLDFQASMNSEQIPVLPFTR